MSKAGLKISDVIAHPLRVTLEKAQRTGFGDYPVIELVVVEIRTDAGVTGWGECLGRSGSPAYADAVHRLLKPLLVGRNPLDSAALWQTMQRRLSGRSGGMLIEAIAGADIALWDIAGKVANLPVHRLLGSMGRTHVDAYASSINWYDDAQAEAETRAALALGFKQIKVKIGRPVAAAIRRAELIRKIAGDDIKLSTDANWAFSLDEAVAVGEALHVLGYTWFEEPIAPEDAQGYAQLRAKTRVRLAAGESDYTVWHASELIAARSVGIIQPDVARAGGISETRRIAELARAFHVAYAPHVGWSGALCVAASLQLAAAMPAFETFECMVYANPLRDALTTAPVGDRQHLVQGQAEVPQGPGLGVEMNLDVLNRHRAV
jgi:L-alanine-DL-glutamate epimerase-like enolase superfamily enzyme